MKGKFLFPIILLITTMTNYCQAQKLSKPESNFEFFWQTFDKNYSGFKVRRVDWRQQYIKYRPLVTQNTTDEELLNILNKMVEPLKDGHVVISKTGDLPASAKYSDFHKQFPTKDSVKLLRNVINKNLSEQGFFNFVKFNSSFPIGGFSASEQYGYLQLNGFGGMAIMSFN